VRYHAGFVCAAAGWGRWRTDDQSGEWSTKGVPVSSVRLTGQGVVAWFSPKWRDTEEAVDASFSDNVPSSGGGFDGPCCRWRSLAGWCEGERDEGRVELKERRKKGVWGRPSLGAGRAAMPSLDSGEFRGGSQWWRDQQYGEERRVHTSSLV
jgi:hypothetical protein